MVYWPADRCVSTMVKSKGTFTFIGDWAWAEVAANPMSSPQTSKLAKRLVFIFCSLLFLTVEPLDFRCRALAAQHQHRGFAFDPVQVICSNAVVDSNFAAVPDVTAPNLARLSATCGEKTTSAAHCSTGEPANIGFTTAKPR